MPRLTLALLGPPEIRLNERLVTGFRTQKVQALLAFLATESARAHPRAELTGLFWPAQPEAAARANLRVSLNRLRSALDERANGPFLNLTRLAVQFDPHSDHALDVAVFQSLLTQCRAHQHEQADACAECGIRLSESVALYRGDFMQGVAVGDSPAFEEWVLMQREALRREALGALASLAAYHERLADYDALAQAARRFLAIEPWHEPAHRQLMRALALSHRRTDALAQYEACRRLLQDELGIEPEIETRALYEQIRADELAPGARSVAPPHNLPYQLAPLFGRERELSQLSALVQQPDARLLTFVGPGGIGKTRLALEVARANLNRFGDGVYFVSLAPLAGASEIGPAIIAAVGLQTHNRTLRETLLQWLRDKRVLLILDNFEHVLAGVDIVVAMLQAAPYLHVIATSSERLNVRGEHLYPVQGLDFAADATLPGSAAVRMFVDRARRVSPAFEPAESDLPDVLHICQLTQGVPLALELAAARIETLSPASIAAEIERSADFLAADWRDVPERQRSMRAVFDWAWHLLSRAEQASFRQLSIFRGGFTREAAQAVAGTSQRVLTGLAHKSLLHWQAQGLGGRFHMHELLRSFAAEQLARATNERARFAARHRAYFLGYVADRELPLARDGSRAATDEIRMELDNVRQAWASAGPAVDVEAMERSAYALWQFYLLSGLWDEGAHAFAQAAEYADAAPVLQSKLLAAHTHFLNHQGNYQQALPLARRVVALAQRCDSREAEAGGELLWAQALHLSGRTQEAHKHAARALRLARGGEREWLRDVEWESHVWLAHMATSASDYRSATREFEEALNICQRWRKLNGEVRCYSNLGAQATSQRDFAGAQQYIGQALRLSREVGNRWSEGVAETDLALVGLEQRAYTQVRAHAERALSIFHELGDRLYQVPTFGAIGCLWDELGQYDRASESFEHFLQAYNEVGAVPLSFEGWCGLALHALHTGDHGRALDCTETMLNTAQQVRSRAWPAQIYVLRGHVLAGAQRPNEAETEYALAIAAYTELGQDAMLAEPRAGLASLALARGDNRRALDLVEPIVRDLEAQPLPTVDDPFRIDQVCYRVLQANGDGRWVDVLHRAQGRLRATADTLGDDNLSHSFLENVVLHRELLHPADPLPPDAIPPPLPTPVPGPG